MICPSCPLTFGAGNHIYFSHRLVLLMVCVCVWCICGAELCAWGQVWHWRVVWHTLNVWEHLNFNVHPKLQENTPRDWSKRRVHVHSDVSQCFSGSLLKMLICKWFLRWFKMHRFTLQSGSVLPEGHALTICCKDGCFSLFFLLRRRRLMLFFCVVLLASAAGRVAPSLFSINLAQGCLLRLWHLGLPLTAVEPKWGAVTRVWCF